MNIAFTGHREYDPALLTKPLVELILSIIPRGEECSFWCGMASGFDLAAGEAVLEAQGRGAAVTLHCVIPFAGHDKSLGEQEYRRYHRLLNEAESVVTLAEHYDRSIFHRRNDYLLSMASMVMAYYDGVAKGGTAYTVRGARRRGVPIYNVRAAGQLELFDWGG